MENPGTPEKDTARGQADGRVIAPGLTAMSACTIFSYMHHPSVLARSRLVSRKSAARKRVRRQPRRAKSTDALSVALASGAFATLVRYFTAGPQKSPHLRALMRDTGLGARSVQMELARMERLGLVRQERAADGRHVVVHVAQLHPAWAPLRALVRTYADPEDVLRMTIAGLPHVVSAFIFGSVARGDARPESDCDLMVIIDATAEEYRAVKTALAVQAGEAGLALGRELSVVVYSVTELQARVAAGHAFISRVLLGAKRWVRGSARELEARLQLPAGVIQ